MNTEALTDRITRLESSVRRQRACIVGILAAAVAVALVGAKAERQPEKFDKLELGELLMESPKGATIKLKFTDDGDENPYLALQSAGGKRSAILQADSFNPEWPNSTGLATLLLNVMSDEGLASHVSLRAGDREAFINVQKAENGRVIGHSIEAGE